MKFPLYAVRDSYIGFSMPVIRDNDSVASRSFQFDCERDNSPYSTRPECFQLFNIGIYDTDSSVVESSSPVLVASAVDFVKKGV